MNKGILFIGLITICFNTAWNISAYEDYFLGYQLGSMGGRTAAVVGTAGLVGHQAFNKYLKIPLRHIQDDVMAVQNAIVRLQNRLRKTLDENDRKKWASHKFEPERIALIKDWLNATEFKTFGEFLSRNSWNIGLSKK